MQFTQFISFRVYFIKIISHTWHCVRDARRTSDKMRRSSTLAVRCGMLCVSMQFTQFISFRVYFIKIISHTWHCVRGAKRTSDKMRRSSTLAVRCGMWNALCKYAIYSSSVSRPIVIRLPHMALCQFCVQQDETQTIRYNQDSWDLSLSIFMLFQCYLMYEFNFDTQNVLFVVIADVLSVSGHFQMGPSLRYGWSYKMGIFRSCQQSHFSMYAVDEN